MMDDAIDVVVTGHTHQAYNCTLDGRLATSASSVGRLVTDIDLTLDRRAGDVLTAEADNVPVVRTVARDAEQTALIARYRELLGPVAGRTVGTATTTSSGSRPRPASRRSATSSPTCSWPRRPVRAPSPPS